MGDASTAPALVSGNTDFDFDVLIIGAGFSGVYSLISMRSLGLRARLFERGTGVGGVWHWNRYPGARFDSESYTYGFSFSAEVLDEWNWSEHYAAQPETLKYINFVVDKYGIRSDIQLNTEIAAAHYQNDSRGWLLIDKDGNRYTSRFLINALGPLTTPQFPNIAGVHDFKGSAYHTSRWPHEPVSFEDKRVGIIGTGATGIQTIQEVAKSAKELFVFQRTPNWTLPMRNSQLSNNEMQKIREDYPEIFRLCSLSPMGFMYVPDERKTLEVPKEERELFWEDLYSRRGLVKWLGNFKDIFTNQQANDVVSDWMSDKIRKRVNDPILAEKLIPKDHGFGTRRVPLETNYYELYNQPNVKLVDLVETPIERITQGGIKTTKEEFPLDILIYATGFDALTGSYEAIDIRGRDGMTLKDKWQDGPETYLGLTVCGFPNMFNVLGPHQASGNIPRSIEYAVKWVTNCIGYCIRHAFSYVEATRHGEEEWTKHVISCTEGLLSTKVNSWMTGYNSNKATKRERTVIRYSGSCAEYRRRCDKVVGEGYTGLNFS